MLSCIMCLTINCAIQYSTHQRFQVPCCNSLDCTIPHYTALQYRRRRNAILYCTVLHYTLLHCPTVHCTTTNYTQLHATLLSIVLSSLPRLFHKGYRREVPLVLRLPLMRALAWRHIVSRMHGRPVHRCALR